MTWNDFINYLKEKIIQQNENASQETWKLTPLGKEKYGAELSETLIQDLETNLSYLLVSHQQRFDSESNFHELPEIEKEVEEEENGDNESDGEESINISSSFGYNSSSSSNKKELKTWKELFPARESCLLGKIENEAVSFETYNLLGRIYEDWRLQGEKAKELEQKAKEWEKKAEKLMKEYISQQASEFFKKKGINVLKGLKDWLRDYESLSPKQQESLKEEKKKIQEASEFLGTENKNQEKETKSWHQNIPWKDILKYGVGGLLILIILGMVIKALKGDK